MTVALDHRLKIGTSLFSFQLEYLQQRWSLEDCFELAGSTGGDRGVEIVGPMHHRSWPKLSREDERTILSAMDRWSLIPSHYGAYSDMTYYWELDARYAVQKLQFEAAKRLGYSVVRIQSPGVDPILERLTELALKMGLRIAIEIHVPVMFESPDFIRIAAAIRKINSPSVGLIIDTGIFEDIVTARRYIGQAVDAQPYPPSDPARLAEFKDIIVGLHGKFHRMANGLIPEVPFDRIVQTLAGFGFNGWMSTEFEGGQLGAYKNSFEVVQTHHAIMKRLVAKYYA